MPFTPTLDAFVDALHTDPRVVDRTDLMSILLARFGAQRDARRDARAHIADLGDVRHCANINFTLELRRDPKKIASLLVFRNVAHIHDPGNRE